MSGFICGVCFVVVYSSFILLFGHENAVLRDYGISCVFSLIFKYGFIYQP